MHLIYCNGLGYFWYFHMSLTLAKNSQQRAAQRKTLHIFVWFRTRFSHVWSCYNNNNNSNNEYIRIFEKIVNNNFQDPHCSVSFTQNTIRVENRNRLEFSAFFLFKNIHNLTVMTNKESISRNSFLIIP